MPNKQVVRGYAYEYLVAQALIDASQFHPYLSEDDAQWDITHTRRKYARQLEDQHREEYLELQSLAGKVALNLPAATGEIQFTPKAANDAEVFDIRYQTSGDRWVKVSCKTREVVDKTVPLCTNGFDFTAINEYNRKIFPPDTPGSYLDHIHASGQRSVAEYLHNVASILTYGEQDTVAMLHKITRERFIGNGGYYKTLDDGGVRLYPELHSDDVLTIENINLVGNHTLEYDAIICLSHGLDSRKYGIRVDVGLKSPSGEVRRAKNGLIKDLYVSATFQHSNMDEFR